jgi:hypothetical protein
MPADATDLIIQPVSPLTGLSSLIGNTARMIGDAVLVARSFRDHPTQLVAAPDRASFLVEVKTSWPAESQRPAAPKRWMVEVSAPDADGLGPVVLCETYRSMSSATRRARAIRRRIRRGAFARSTRA